MKKAVSNRGASIRAKLLEHARKTKQEFQFVLDRWAAERFLFRLGRSKLRKNFILKGATLFLIWRGDLPRRTRDIDLLGYGSSNVDDVARAMREICLIEADDGIVFHADDIAVIEIRADAEYDGVRVKVPATLDKAKTTLQVDIGFGDVVMPAVEDRHIPTILPLEAPSLRTYPAETVIAEKFQAMVQLDIANSRMKDFYDIWLLSQEQQFEMDRLADALKATFQRRRTELPSALPTALSEKFLEDKAKLWREFLSRVGLSPSVGDLSNIAEAISGFLMPVVEHIHTDTPSLWWSPGGPWVQFDARRERT